MWQSFTTHSRRIVFYAQEEAGALGRTDVASEHLLLGLLREVAAAETVWPPAPTDRIDAHNIVPALLNEAGGDLEELRANTKRQSALLALPTVKGANDVTMTPSAKQVINTMFNEARLVGAGKLTPEFLLLALIGDEAGTAGQLLKQFGLDLETARLKVAAIHMPVKKETSVKPSLLTKFVKQFTAKPKEVR